MDSASVTAHREKAEEKAEEKGTKEKNGCSPLRLSLALLERMLVLELRPHSESRWSSRGDCVILDRERRWWGGWWVNKYEVRGCDAYE